MNGFIEHNIFSISFLIFLQSLRNFHGNFIDYSFKFEDSELVNKMIGMHLLLNMFKVIKAHGSSLQWWTKSTKCFSFGIWFFISYSIVKALGPLLSAIGTVCTVFPRKLVQFALVSYSIRTIYKWTSNLYLDLSRTSDTILSDLEKFVEQSSLPMIGARERHNGLPCSLVSQDFCCHHEHYMNLKQHTKKKRMYWKATIPRRNFRISTPSTAGT